jgi:ATP-dependent Zn protease
MSRRVTLAFLLILVLTPALVAASYTFLTSGSRTSTVGWGQFLQFISTGQVAHVVQEGSMLTVTDIAGNQYTVTAPGVRGVNADYLVDFQRAAADGGRTFDATTYAIQPVPDTSWIGLVLTGLLPLLVIGSFVFFMSQAARKQARAAAHFQSRPPALSLTDRLRQLDEARAAGLMTADEYDAKRAQIVDAI